jgi:hypothetical protein
MGTSADIGKDESPPNSPPISYSLRLLTLLYETGFLAQQIGTTPTSPPFPIHHRVAIAKTKT